jgi:hypothetical protein
MALDSLTNTKTKLLAEDVAFRIPKGPWFHFDQNNSGGKYYGPMNVLVVAENEAEAFERLEAMPGYTTTFCACCGQRWSSANLLTQEEVVALIVAWSDPGYFPRQHSPGTSCLLIMAE